MELNATARPAGILPAGRSAGDPADRLALRDLAESYAAACDARDEDLFVSLFTDDAVLRVCYANLDEPAMTVVGGARMASIPRALGARFVETLHLVGNHRCQVEGDSARGEAYCEAHHLHTGTDGEPADLRLLIRYADEYARGSDGVWRFARRTVNVRWQQVAPVTGSVLHRS